MFYFFIFSPALFASELVSVFPGSGSNVADSTASRVGPQWGVLMSNNVSSYQNISPVDDSSLISFCFGVSRWFLAAFFDGGTRLERAQPTACLRVSTVQSQLHTERSGGRTTPAESCWLGLKWEEQRGRVRGHETGDEQTGHPLTGSSVRMWLTLSEGCASPPVTWPLPASYMRWQHIFPVFRLSLPAAEYSRTMAGFDFHFLLQPNTIHLLYEGVKKSALVKIHHITNRFSYSVQTIHFAHF